MVPCYYLVKFGCFICMNMLFYIFSGTNLLTQCQVPASVFPCFWPIFRRSPNGMKLYDDFFLDQKRPPKLWKKARRATRESQAQEAPPPPRPRLPGLGPPHEPNQWNSTVINSYKSRNLQKQTYIGSSAAASLCSHQKPIWIPFRHPAGGGIHLRWPTSSSRRSPWWGASSSPLGLRVCTSSYVFDLSLSCSWDVLISMYHGLCYYSWILWCSSPSPFL